ncbi:hypothetical protein OTU49_014342, partial [Cherax quadricarinatus]
TLLETDQSTTSPVYYSKGEQQYNKIRGFAFYTTSDYPKEMDAQTLIPLLQSEEVKYVVCPSRFLYLRELISVLNSPKIDQDCKFRIRHTSIQKFQTLSNGIVA